MYFIQFLIWTEGGYLIPLGRTDQILYPFYDRDISAGRLTPERALEIMECFLDVYKRQIVLSPFF